MKKQIIYTSTEFVLLTGNLLLIIVKSQFICARLKIFLRNNGASIGNIFIEILRTFIRNRKPRFY